jgi:hypothetical protein
MAGTFEFVELAAGDSLIMSAERTESLWREEPPPTTGVEERPEAHGDVKFGKLSVEVPLTVAATFGVVCDVYVNSGAAALDSFLRENDMVGGFTADPGLGARLPPSEREPAEQQLTLHRLIDRSMTHLHSIRESSLAMIAPLAQQAGLARLKDARSQVESEIRRYFVPAGGHVDSIRALESGASFEHYFLETAFSDVRGLLAEIKRCQELIALAADVDRRVQNVYLRRTRSQYEAPTSSEHLYSSPDDSPHQPFEPVIIGPSGVVETALRGFEPMVALEEEAAAAHAKVMEYVARAGLGYPILWKIFATRHVSDLDALGGEMLHHLRETYQANLELEALLKDDPQLVWHFEPIVHEALKDALVPMHSVGWTAAHEQVEATSTEMRLSSELAMASGLATLGAGGIVALAGASSVAPPLAVVVGVLKLIDTGLNAYDVLQEYLHYRHQLAAFHATLDPTLALAEEPGIAWLALSAGLFAAPFVGGALTQAGRALR